MLRNCIQHQLLDDFSKIVREKRSLASEIANSLSTFWQFRRTQRATAKRRWRRQDDIANLLTSISETWANIWQTLSTWTKVDKSWLTPWRTNCQICEMFESGTVHRCVILVDTKNICELASTRYLIIYAPLPTSVLPRERER